MSDLILFDVNWKFDLIIGLVVGGLLIGLHALAPSVTMGFPTIPEATQGERLGIVGVLAPVGEELLFRLVIFNMFILLGLSVFLALPLQALLFGLAHAWAYSGSFTIQGITSVGAAIFGAALFGLIFGALAYWRKNPLASMTPHAMYNIFLASQLLVVFG